MEREMVVKGTDNKGSDNKDPDNKRRDNDPDQSAPRADLAGIARDHGQGSLRPGASGSQFV